MVSGNLTINDIMLYLGLITAVVGLLKSKRDIVSTINKQAEAEAKWQTTVEMTLQVLKDSHLTIAKKLDDLYNKIDFLDKEVFMLKHASKKRNNKADEE